MSGQRRGGLISLQLNGVIHDAKGNFTVGLARTKREGIVGADGMHGYKESPVVQFIEGAVTDRGTLDVDALVNFKDGTVTLESASGKVYVARNAYYAGDGTLTTEEGEIPVRFEGEIEEVR